MREEKQLLLDEIREKIEDSKGFVIARYEQMDAGRTREFRALVAQSEGDFEVMKKRLFIKVLESAGHKLRAKEYEGHVGVIFTKDDPIALSKICLRYGADNDKKITLLGGLIDGQYCSGKEIEALAKLPALPQLRAQFLGLLEAPLAQTVGLMQSLLASLLYGLEEKSKQGSAP